MSKLMGAYEAERNIDDHINGWRIKLISTTDRRKLESTKYRFAQRFPDLAYTSHYENPYYSLKVGAFETRYDIEPYLVRFKDHFREAIPFRDQIKKAEIFDFVE